MKVQDCIPKDKQDLLALERAQTIGFPSLNEVLPDMLEWLQDANWPVARPTASVLANAGTEIAPYINDILAGKDSIWKYWLIELLVQELSSDVLSELRHELQRLARQPTRNDKLEKVDTLAQHVLAARRL